MGASSTIQQQRVVLMLSIGLSIIASLTGMAMVLNHQSQND
tara:strand:- start:421 stop:543 length:123 start_codon:yes stop_codon:yes gene_type:complete